MAELNYQEKQVRQIHRITEALDEGTLARVRRMIATLSASEVADLLESLPPAKRLMAWELVDPELDGEVLVEVNDEVRSQLIRGMDQPELVNAIGTLDIDDVADIVDDLPDAVIREVMTSMDRQNREDLVRVLQYDEDSAGGLMSTDVVTVRPDVSLDVVQRYLRARGALPDLTDQLFVINRNGKYQGSLSLHDLLVSDADLTVADVINSDMQSIPVNMPDNEVAREFTHYDMVSAPVVDVENNLLGRITIDDVIDVIREQAEHSVLAVAGLDEEEDMFAPVLKSALRRTLWLGINLLTAFLAAAVIGQFEESLAAVVALAILMPVVASMGGIAGTQTLTLMVRGMALGQITASNALYMLRKELLVGVINGLLWALVVGAVALMWFGDLELSLVIAIAIALNLIVAALSGVGIPLLLRRLRIDPALAGGVVLTTVTDVIGFVVFLGLGTIILLQ
jgi:magnesium transporter